MAAGEGATTLRDVAKQMGCSVATVSNAINGRGRMSDKTREEILQHCAELKFVPNSTGRSLRLQRTGVIGVIYAPSFAELFGNVFYARIMEGLAQTFGEAGIDLMLGNRIEQSGIPSIVRQGKVDALIVLAGVFEKKDYENLKDCPVPMCIVDGHVDTIEADTLSSDGFGGGHLVARHLLENGHQNMAMIAYQSPLYNIEQRIAGFMESVRSAGFATPEEDLILRVSDNGQATAMIKERLEGPNPPTAVFAVNDTLAEHLILTLTAAGISIPEDLSIVGFDDDPLAARCQPALTTIGMAKRDFGVISAKLVLDRLAQPDMPAVHQVQSTRLVIRDSVRKL